MNNAVKVMFASLVGGLAVHGALSACGGSGSTANASPSSCATWRVASFDLSGNDFGYTSNNPKGVTLPAGWEPFAPFQGNQIFIRSCAP